MSISKEAWIAELERSVRLASAEGLSVAEMVEQTGKGERVVRQWLRRAIGLGEWRCVGRKSAEAIDGRQLYVPCYRPVEMVH